MRKIIFSFKSKQQLRDLLAQGKKQYSAELIAEKRALVYSAFRRISTTLPNFESSYPRDAELGLCRFRVKGTPFLIYFSIDGDEVHIELILHEHSDR